MTLLLLIGQILTALLLSSLILLQAKGTGLGRSFGSTQYHSRRGLENLIFKLTVILSVLFVGISLAKIFLP